MHSVRACALANMLIAFDIHMLVCIGVCIHAAVLELLPPPRRPSCSFIAGVLRIHIYIYAYIYIWCVSFFFEGAWLFFFCFIDFFRSLYGVHSMLCHVCGFLSLCVLASVVVARVRIGV